MSYMPIIPPNVGRPRVSLHELETMGTVPRKPQPPPTIEFQIGREFEALTGMPSQKRGWSSDERIAAALVGGIAAFFIGLVLLLFWSAGVIG